MRLPALAAAFALAAAAAPAAVVSPVATLRVVSGALSGDYSFPILGDGSVRGALSLAACDGSVREAVACDGSVRDWSLSVGLAGSQFPFIAALVNFIDEGDPSAFTVAITVPIPVIGGPASWTLAGAVTLAPFEGGVFVSPPPALAGFGEAYASVAPPVASFGPNPIATSSLGAVMETFAANGGFDCGLVGGCDVITVVLGAQGLGRNHQIRIQNAFDLDEAVAPIPLPAPVALLASAFAGLAVAGRRRQLRREVMIPVAKPPMRSSSNSL